MFGGAVENNTIVNDVWSYNVTSASWSLLNISSKFGNEVPSLIGHTAHVTKSSDDRDIMLIFFGYHPSWGVSNLVFELDLGKYYQMFLCSTYSRFSVKTGISNLKIQKLVSLRSSQPNSEGVTASLPTVLQVLHGRQ